MLYILSMLFLFAGFITLLFKTYILAKDNNKPINKRKDINYCIVINTDNYYEIIDSLENQSIRIKSDDIYLVTDEKINIKYSINIINKKIGIVIKELTKKYNSIIFINDNIVLDNNCIKEMINNYKLGYDVVVGNKISYKNSFRNSINLIPNFIINVLNKNRVKNNSNVFLNNELFMCNSETIKKIDINNSHNMTIYSINNKLTTYYNCNAFYYNNNNELSFFKTISYFFKAKQDILIPSVGNNYGSQVNLRIGIKPYLYITIGIIFLIIQEVLLKNYITIFIILLLISLLLTIIFTLFLIIDKD